MGNPSSFRWEIPHLLDEKSPKLIKNPLLLDKKSHLFVNEIIWSSLYIYLFCKHTVVINCPDTKEIMQSNLLNHSLLYLCSLCQNCLPSSVAGVYTSSPSRRIQMSALAPQTYTQSTNKQDQDASVQKTVWTVKRCIYMVVYFHFYWCRWAVVDSTVLYWAVLGCTGLYWAALGCTGLGCSGI